MEEKQCKNCQYFMQHYTLTDSRLIQVDCGHCIFKNPKRKRPTQNVCEHFEQGEVPLAKFVSKEYLSKKLLEKVLNMELLPNVEYRG